MTWFSDRVIFFIFQPIENIQLTELNPFTLSKSTFFCMLDCSLTKSPLQLSKKPFSIAFIDRTVVCSEPLQLSAWQVPVYAL